MANSTETMQLSSTEKERLQQILDKHLAERVAKIKSLAETNPNDPFVLANQHMLELSTQTSWAASGEVSMAGALWWTAALSVALDYPHTVIFTANGGPDFDFAVFTSAVFGHFYTDPSKMHGEYQFDMQAVSVVDGEVTFNLYDMNWSQVGSFAGVTVGAGGCKVTGTGDLKYN